MHGDGEGLDVQLSQCSMDGLQELSELTGRSDADNLNRALQVYAFIERQLAQGCSLAFMQPGGSTKMVEITDAL